MYVVLFHSGNAKSDSIRTKTSEYDQALKEIEESYPEFTYAVVDASAEDYADLVAAASIDVAGLDINPSILMMLKGNGQWVHGPRSLSKILEFAPPYLQKLTT